MIQPVILGFFIGLFMIGTFRLLIRGNELNATQQDIYDLCVHFGFWGSIVTVMI